MQSFVLFLLFCFLVACNHQQTLPKPKSYFRIDFPAKAYRSSELPCNISFQYPVYATPLALSKKEGDSVCKFNLQFPQLKSQLHLSYIQMNNNLTELIEDSRQFAYKHTVKANAIKEVQFDYPEKQVHGLVYEIEGNTASNIQFFATDSARHFVRGSLYFWATPNADSLAPVLQFLREDIVYLIASLQWKAGIADNAQARPPVGQTKR